MPVLREDLVRQGPRLAMQVGEKMIGSTLTLYLYIILFIYIHQYFLFLCCRCLCYVKI